MKNLRCFILSMLMLCCSCEPKVCKVDKIATLYITPGIHDRDTTYGHYVLLKGIYKECMDSVTMVNIALKYIDTVKGKRPVDDIMFYNSDEEFRPGAVPSSPDLENSCLVKIGFDSKTNKPEDFLFYDNDGENIYWGQEWKKDGEKK